MILGTDPWSPGYNDNLIQQAEKKENSSSKRYEMRYEMSFGDAVLKTDRNTVFTATMHFIVLKLWMTHKQMIN